jgi:hypothetical protein
MGASQFCTKVQGPSAARAFLTAVEHAKFMYGHGGYTGSIAEKDTFIEITVPEDKDPRDFATMLLDGEDVDLNGYKALNEQLNDKWGPAGCVRLGPNAKDKTQSDWLFFGWASS